MKSKHCLTVLAALMILDYSGNAQQRKESTLWLAGMEMRLGMQQAPLLAKLEAQYKLTPSSGGIWIIRERNPFTGMYDILGSVVFKDGKLLRASKD